MSLTSLLPIADASTIRGEAQIDLAELVIWVRTHVAQLIEKRIPQNQGRVRWCRSWWLHGEAIARFDALHRSWTDAITGAGNALVTYYEHLDRQLAALTDEDGPFAACRGGDHAHDTRTGPLGQREPDPDFYRDLADFSVHRSQKQRDEPAAKTMPPGHP